MTVVDFGSTYTAPGVYVQQDVSSPSPGVSGSAAAVLAIVGPSIGFRTNTVAITLTGTTPSLLPNLGIDIASSGVNVLVQHADGTTVTSSDYVLVVGGGADSNTGTLPDNTTTIARSNSSGLANPERVYVTYRYTDASFFTPRRVRDIDEAKTFFGEAFDTTTNAILSPLTLAAQLAFTSGASEMVLVPSAGSPTAVTRSQLATAYNQLEGVYDATVVVPLPVGLTGTANAPGDIINVGVDLKNRLNSDASDRQARVGFLGYETSVTVLPASIAAGVAAARVGLVWPNRWMVYNGLNNQQFEVAGYYAAAAVGGRAVSIPVQQALTRQLVSGFSGIPADLRVTMTRQLKDTWSSSGVMVIEPDRNNNLLIRHGVSTDFSSLVTREISLTRAKDRMVQVIQDTLDAAGLIGSPISLDMPVRIKGVVAGCLETVLNSGVIVSYQNLKVRQGSTDPTVMEVKFEYLPPYPVNYISVSFAINVATNTLLAA